MRLATILAAAMLVTGSVALTRPATALPPGDVYYEGLHLQPLGGATLTVTSTFPSGLEVNNIGSSGQDGVSVDLGPIKTKGHNFTIPAGPVLPEPGSSRMITMKGGGGAGGLVTAGQVTEVTNSDGSETLTPDFSDVGVSSVWVVLVDGAGNVLKRVHRPFVIVREWGAAHPQLAQALCVSRTPAYRWIALDYESDVSVDLGDGGPETVCEQVRFICDTGDAVDDLTSIELRCATPGVSPPGSLSISEMGIVPPCAGCPNGPDDNADMVAFGSGTYGPVAPGEQRLPVHNIGSSGNDGIEISLGRQACCHNGQIGVSISDVTQTSALQPGSVVFEGEGFLAGDPNHPMGSLSCTYDASSSSFHPDFSPVGATGYHVLLYLGGVLVADVPNPATDTGREKPLTGHVTLIKFADGPGFRILCITAPCPGDAVTVNGTVYVADEIDFRPIGVPVTPADISALYVKPTGTSSITFDEADFNSTAPLVSVDRPSQTIDFAGAQLSPNPASGPVNVLFTMPRAGRARVSVIDVTGRQVRGLAEGVFGAGAHDLRWDGRDDAGRTAAAGVYFVRVETGGSARVSRVTRLW